MATPSINLATFRGYLNELLGDIPATATTDTAGATDKTTAVASPLIERYDDFLQNGLDTNSYLFVPYVAEERRIFNILPETGTVVVKYPFTAQVATAKPIEIHRYKPSDKLKAINRALVEVFTRKDFYNPQYVTSLYGQESYGVSPYEYNRRLYAVPTAFEEFPTIRIVKAYTGLHTGADAAAVLTDGTKAWMVSELVGLTLYNKTDGSSTTVTANTSTTVTGVLTGGTDNDWDTDDEYIVQDPSAIPSDFTDYVKAGSTGAFTFYAVIPESRLLLLTGKGPFTVLTSAGEIAATVGTTELNDEQARIVAYYAAYCFWDTMASRMEGQESAPYENKAQIRLGQYLMSVKPAKMDNSPMLKVDNSWLR